MIKTDKFTNLIADHLGLISEEDPATMAPPPEGAVPPEQEAPAPPVQPDADVPVDQDARSLGDLAIASRIALQLKTITPEDRELLIQVPSQDNAESLRELLNSIAGWYDTPN
jgi:hypothetical protein